MNNNETHKIYSVFPNPVFVDKFNGSDNGVDEFLNNTSPTLDSNTLPNGEKAEEVWGKNSVDIQTLKSKELVDLRQFILERATFLATSILGFRIEGITDVLSWTSFKEMGNEHRSHIHPNSFISGTYYYDEVDASQPLVFERQISFNNCYQFMPMRDASNRNIFSAVQEVLPVNKGDLVLFPSFMPHYVPKNTTPNVRKCLTFNLMPINGLGDPLHMSEFVYTNAIQY